MATRIAAKGMKTRWGVHRRPFVQEGAVTRANATFKLVWSCYGRTKIHATVAASAITKLFVVVLDAAIRVPTACQIWSDSLEGWQPQAQLGDGFSCIDHPHPDKGNRDEAATQSWEDNLKVHA